MAYDYNLIVIGAGPGGLAAAKRAAKYGVKVAIAEKNDLGGTCANRGCVPKKLMVYAADFARLFQDAADYGWEPPTSHFHWQRFVAARDQNHDRLSQSQEKNLKAAGIDLIKGAAQFLDAHTLEIEERKLTADKVLIAVGGKPIKPDIPGIEHAFTSDEMFQLQQLPKRIAIIGGGYIGVEFASILCGFGCEVFLMNHEQCILSGFDDDVAVAVREGLMARGIQSWCSTTAKEIEPVPTGFRLTLTGCPDGEGPDTVTVDTVLCATGRAPNLKELGLENAGVEADKKAIAVNEYSQTSQSNIFAVGDCTNRIQLTPVAKAEGEAFADTEFGAQRRRVNYDYVPSAVCARPEAASVGMSEAQAREKNGDAVQCYKTEFLPLRENLTRSQQKSLIKLVVDSESDRVLGVHMVGEDAAEIVQNLTVALQLGATKQNIDAAIGIHPSSAEELFSLE